MCGAAGNGAVTGLTRRRLRRRGNRGEGEREEGGERCDLYPEGKRSSRRETPWLTKRTRSGRGPRGDEGFCSRLADGRGGRLAGCC